MSTIRVLGCGNPLSYDEGVGIHVLRRLNGEILPENVEIREFRVPGGFNEELITGVDKIIIIDACSGEGCNGINVNRTTPQNNDLKGLLSSTVHAYNLYPLFRSNDRLLPEPLPQEIVIITVEIEVRNKFSVGLSKNVFSSLDTVIQKVLAELY